MPLSIEEIQVLLTARSNLSPVVGRAAASLRRLQSNIGGITASLGKMTAALGGVNALSLTALTAAGIRAGSEFNQVADTLEEDVGRLQALFLDIKTTNPTVQLDNLSEGLRTLSERFSEARQGSGDAVDALERLGVDINVNGAINQLEEVRQKFQDIETVSERIELANILFGDEDARQVLNYLRATEEQIDRVREARERLGLIVPQEALDNIREARLAMGTLQSVFTQLSVAVAGQVTPIITQAAASFLAFVEANGGVVDFVDKLFDFVRVKAEGLFKTVSTIANAIRKVYVSLTGDLDALTLNELRKRREELTDSLTSDGLLDRAADSAGRVLSGQDRDDQQQELGKVIIRIKDIEEGQNRLTSATNAGTDAWREYLETQTELHAAAAAARAELQAAATAANNQGTPSTAGIPIPGAGAGATTNNDNNFGGTGKSLEQLRDEQRRIFEELERRRNEGISTIAEVIANVSGPTRLEDLDAQVATPDLPDDPFEKSTESAKSFQDQLNEVASSFSNLASVAGSSGNRMFQQIQAFSEAAAAAAALGAAVQAAQAAAIGGPLAALGAAATVGASLFRFVNAIEGISPGNAPSSPPGVGGAGSTNAAANTGPQGGTADTTDDQGGDIINVTIQGQADDKITVQQFNDFLNILRNDESRRRQTVRVLGV